MLNIYPSPNRGGSVPEASDPALPASTEGVAWIDLLEPTDSEIAFVESSTGLRVPRREALREIESSSRNYMEGGAVYLSTPLIARAFSSEGALTPVGFVFNQKILITIRYAPFVAFDVVAQQSQNQSDLTAEEALVRLMESIIDKGADLLERVGEELDKVSRAAFHTDQSKGARKNLAAATEQLRHTLRRIGQMGDRTSQIRDSLLGVGRITGYMTETACQDWPQPLKQRMGAVRGDIASLNDYEQHLANKVQFLLDATLGFISIEQNDIVKVLTVASVVGVPPVFFAGVWGMNFHNIPEFGWSFGYPFAWAVMILSAVVPLVWFKRRGWM